MDTMSRGVWVKINVWKLSRPWENLLHIGLRCQVTRRLLENNKMQGNRIRSCHIISVHHPSVHHPRYCHSVEALAFVFWKTWPPPNLIADCSKVSRLSHFGLKSTHTTKYPSSFWQFLLLARRHLRCCQLQKIICLTDVCLVQSFRVAALMLENFQDCVHPCRVVWTYTLEPSANSIFFVRNTGPFLKFSLHDFTCYTNEILQLPSLPLLPISCSSIAWEGTPPPTHLCKAWYPRTQACPHSQISAANSRNLIRLQISAGWKKNLPSTCLPRNLSCLVFESSNTFPTYNWLRQTGQQHSSSKNIKLEWAPSCISCMFDFHSALFIPLEYTQRYQRSQYVFEK